MVTVYRWFYYLGKVTARGRLAQVVKLKLRRCCDGYTYDGGKTYSGFDKKMV
jgi:hypothetical protein